MKRILILLFFLCCWNFSFSQSTVTLTIENANCSSPTGTVTINSVTTSASPNYTIAEASTTLASNVAVPYSITNVSVGTHTYVITGSNSVAITFTATVNLNNTAPSVTANVNGTVTCNAPLVLLSGISNIGNANYFWSPQNVTTFTALSGGGPSTLTVTDPLNNCSTTTVVNVAQNTVTPNSSASTNGYISCKQFVVVLTGTSTTSGVTYSWNPTGATTNSISSTTPGIYTLTVTDPINGCRSIQIVTVIPIFPFTANTGATLNVKCNGAATGSVEVTINGGAGTYSVVVNNSVSLGAINSFTISVPNLAAGTNTIFLLDTLSGCTGTVNVIITQPSPVVVTLTLASQAEICEGEQVKINSTVSGGVFPYLYLWQPVGGNTLTLDVLAGPNSYTLYATDANSCVVNAVRTITVHPKPQTVLLNAPVALCGSVCVNFSLAAAQNTTYVYNWLFTDVNNVVTPIQVNQYTPSICFTQPGLYDVDLSVISLFGCSTQSIFPTFIKSYPFVRAAYSYEQPEGAFIFNDVIFTNQSTGATNYSWYNENDLFSTKYQPVYNFSEPGYYLVSLIASNAQCSDTLSKKISVSEATFIHIPNAFTPNNDHLNDVWRPVFYGDFQGGSYELDVFNRWGKKVFHTVIIDTGWDGTFKDKPCEDGIYSWEMQIEAGGINTKKKGMITLIR